MQCSIMFDCSCVRFPNVRLCSIGKMFWWVRLPNPIEVNRKIGVRLGSITERSIDYAGNISMFRTAVHFFSTCQAIKGLFYRDQFRLGFKWEISVRFPRWEQAKYPRDDFWREMRKSKHVEAQKSVITFAPVSFGNSYSCITAVKWDAHDVGNTAGKARRSGRSELIPLCRLLRSRMEKPRSREPIQPALSNKHIEDFTKDLEIRRDLGNRAHVKRP